MDKMYERSFKELGKLKKLPTWREWNKIAMKKNLLSNTSMRAYASKNFNLIYRDARIKYLEAKKNKD